MIARVSGVAKTSSWPPRAWSAWPWVTSARGLGTFGSIHASAGFMYRPSGKGSIQEPRRAIGAIWPRSADNRRSRAMDGGGGIGAVITIGGPLLLGGVLLWALRRTRRARRGDVDRTEQATRDLYREEEERRRTGDDGR